MTAEPEETKVIESVAGLLEALSAVSVPNAERWFRGQRDATWSLTPAVFRNAKHQDNEDQMVARFRQYAATHGQPFGFDRWGWIAYAQHHGLPTRLLDWTESPLIALYFATRPSDDAVGPDLDTQAGRFFMLDPRSLNEESGKRGIHLLADSDPVMENYLPGTQHLNENPLAAVAPMLFDRIRFQTGMFTVSTPPQPGSNNDRLMHSRAIESWIVPNNRKALIRDELEFLGFDESTVFKDLDRLVGRIKLQALGN